MKIINIFFGVLWSFHSIRQLLYIFKMTETGVGPGTTLFGCIIAALYFFYMNFSQKQKENDNYDD